MQGGMAPESGGMSPEGKKVAMMLRCGNEMLRHG
jgi:hypothetical protein